MGRTTVVRTVDAPLELVFDKATNIETLPEVVPDVLEVSFLSSSRKGVGTRFRQTRAMGRRTSVTELEVTEYVLNERARMVADQGGTIWDTVYSTRPMGDGSIELKVVMDANAYKTLPKLLNPLIGGFVRKAINADMDAIKASCETPAGEHSD